MGRYLGRRGFLLEASVGCMAGARTVPASLRQSLSEILEWLDVAQDFQYSWVATSVPENGIPRS